MSDRHRIATVNVDSWFHKDYVYAEAINVNASVLASHDTKIAALNLADSNRGHDIENLIGAVNSLAKRVRTLEAEVLELKGE